MTIPEMQELLAEKISSDYTSWNEIVADTTPGHYGADDIEIELNPNDIWVDIPNRTFSFKNANVSFTARLGGSSDDDGHDMPFDTILAGNGVFEFSANGSDIDIKEILVPEEIYLFEDDN